MRILSTLLILCLAGSCQQSHPQLVANDDALIYLDNKRGAALLSGATSSDDFLPLISRFETQRNLAYCGPASCTMVLNALEVEAPETDSHGSYRFFTQENLFTEDVEKVIDAGTVRQQGMTLDELAGVLLASGVNAGAVHAESTNLSDFRKKAIAWIDNEDAFVLVNYLRSAIGQKKGGHISPVAAYDSRTDRFLILDVSRYKYSPVWVGAADLFEAMNTTDSTSGKSRGFVLVSSN
jgi:hypothetical protein